MNTQGFLILLIPILGLCAICRGGRWHWDVISSDGMPVLRSNFIRRLLLGMFWLGWSTSLIVGVLMLFGVWPTSH
jgi:hypothetical protein